MALIDELSPASYKGASFLISNANTTGGRKDQRHEFPNSNKQTIEDFGLLPRTYNVVGLITGPDYFDKRDKLLAALESSTPGVLSHPFYGEIDNIKARTFQIREDLTDLGRAEFSMVFEISDTIGVPEESENTLALLNTTNDLVQTTVNVEIAGSWEVDTGLSGNFEDAQASTGKLSTGYESASNVIVKNTEKINDFNAELSAFSSKINSLILSPSTLADSITSLADNLNSVYDTAEQKFTVWRELFNFGENGITLSGITAGLQQRQANNDVLNQSIQTQALSYAYLAAAEIDYSNTSELDETSAVLETQYRKIIKNTTLSEALFNALTDMRENTNDFFNQQRLTLNRIITITTPVLPARVLSFQYYGSPDNGEEIARLNNEANVSFIEGQIQIVSQ